MQQGNPAGHMKSQTDIMGHHKGSDSEPLLKFSYQCGNGIRRDRIQQLP